MLCEPLWGHFTPGRTALGRNCSTLSLVPNQSTNSWNVAVATHTSVPRQTLTVLRSAEGPLKNVPCERYIPRVPAKDPKREFKVGDKIRVNLHHGKIEDAVVRALIHDEDVVKLQVDVVGLDLTALIDTRQVVDY